MDAINLFDLYAKITLDDSEYNEKVGQASESGSKLSGVLKSGLATAGKAAAAGMAAASAAVAALGKSALESYAEYEQLVGGVDTLFKESSGKLQEYAANAYQTAGMSANDYMSTVTSFSASLLQSLGGDTAAAADYADRAITDMSDNANKMGTSVEMIQNAYQGFAKQNFTMLDNLKLGYGGTKEEMQRLLDDAEKLSGKKFDISSFADITEAIHVMQEEMGIAGATAAEASTTIEGSVNSMKSAWANLVTGIADDNADLDTLIGNFVNSVETVGGNIMPRVEKILGGVGDLVTQLAPIITEAVPTIVSEVLPPMLDAGSQLLMGLVNGIVSVLPTITTAAVDVILALATGLVEQLPALVAVLPQIISAIVTGLSALLPQLLQMGGTLISQLADGFRTGLPNMVAKLPEVVNTAIDFLNEELPKFLEEGEKVLNSLIDGILRVIPVLVESLPQVIDGILNFITDNLPSILDKGIEIVTNLAFGILEAIPDLVAKLPQIITSIAEFMTKNFPVILEKGGELLGQLIAGILGMIPEIAVQLPQVIDAVVDAIKAGWEFIKNAGGYLLEGLWSGISDKIEWLKGKVNGVVDTIKGWFTGKDGFDTHSPSRWAEKVFANVMEGGAKGLEEGVPALLSEVQSVTDRVKNGMQFGAGSVDFASSGLGMSSAGIINGLSNPNGSGPSSLTVNLVLPDGTVLASYLLGPLADFAKANGTPILNPI